MHFISEDVENLTGYPPSDFLYNTHRTFESVIHPDDRERFKSRVDESIQLACAFTIEYRVIHRDGEVRWVREKGQGMFDDWGQCVWMDGAIFDITDRKQLEFDLVEAKKEAEQGLRGMSKVFMESTDPIMIEDLNGVVIEMNDEAVNTYGWPREELIGKPIITIVPPERHHQANELLKRCKAGEIVRSIEGIRWTKQGDHIPVLLTFSLIKDEDGNPTSIATSAKDITEIKQAETELIEKQEQLEKLIEDRTEELRKIERFNKLAVDREHRIIELKQEVNKFCEQTGANLVYREKFEAQDSGLEQDDVVSVPSEKIDASSQNNKLIFTELIDIDQMQKLLDDFCESVEIASAIIDLEGNVLAASRWQKACTDFHRKNEGTCKNCIESDTDLALKLQEGQEFSIYRCKNGLTDAASPIIINGEHIANVFIGQFFLHSPDMDFFANQANEYGFNQEEYLAAIQNVPVVDEERLPNIMGFLVGFANLVANISIEKQIAAKIQQEMKAKTSELERERVAAMSVAEDAEKARAEKAHYQDHLEELVENRTKELQEKFDQLNRFRRMSVDREKKMIELKKEINDLLEQTGQNGKYKIHE